MGNQKKNKHISQQFEAELEDIRTKVLAMGELVGEQLANAITALRKPDDKLAKQVIKSDTKVNKQEMKIDDDCVHIIVRRQPAACDLRLVIAIIKIISELERIGDVASKISSTALKECSQSHKPLSDSLKSRLESLGDHTKQMLHDVLKAFKGEDLEEATRVYKENDKVDQEHAEIVLEIVDYMIQDPSAIPSVIDVLSCARSIERIGARCQNICEFIFYYIKGKDIRHCDSQDLEKLLLTGNKNKG